jgi:myo-inositol-1(or 4)-monophosphatase
MQLAGGLDSGEDSGHSVKLSGLKERRKMPSVNDLLRVAESAARRAGDYLRTVDRPRDPAGWTSKGRADWATDVDRTAEAIITECLLGAEPGSRIIGEELTPEIVTDGLVWVVDPLDGTTNFLHGFPAFAVSIAAAVDGQLEAAAVLHVPLNRMTRAVRGGGTWEGDTRVTVSTLTDPAHALIGTGLPYRDFTRIDEYLAQLGRIIQGATGVRRPGSAAIDLADVAAGRFEGFWEQRLSAWDIAAGTLLVREAGGMVTDYTGRDLGIEHSGVVAGNPAIHRWLLATIRG